MWGVEQGRCFLIMVSLDELKKLMEEHLRRELDILEMVLKLEENEAEKVLKWYLNHPLVRA